MAPKPKKFMSSPIGKKESLATALPKPSEESFYGKGRIEKWDVDLQKPSIEPFAGEDRRESLDIKISKQPEKPFKGTDQREHLDIEISKPPEEPFKGEDRREKLAVPQAAKQKQVANIRTKSEKMSPFELAELLCGQYIIKAFGEQERIGVYDRDMGCFTFMRKKRWPMFMLKALAGTPQNALLTKSTIDATFMFLVNEPMLQASFDDFDRREDLINVKNGVVSIKDLKLHPHSPQYLFSSRLNVNYNPNAKKPAHFCDMLCRIFKDGALIQLCLESIAYLLSNDSTAKKLVYFYGAPSSGKSTLARLLGLLHGQEYVSSVALERFAGRFELGSVMHKRLNQCPEVESIKPRVAHIIKAVTGGDSQALEDKFEDLSFNRLKLKFLLMGNPPLPHIPPRLTQDEGFLSRFLFVPFENTICASDRHENYERFLFDKEGEGILRILLLFLNRWRRQKREFSRCESSDALLDEFAERSIQTERDFVNACCVLDAEAFSSSELLHDRYVEYCSKHEYRADSYEDFKEALSVIVPILRFDRHRVDKDGNPLAGFWGLRLSDNENVVKK